MGILEFAEIWMERIRYITIDVYNGKVELGKRSERVWRMSWNWRECMDVWRGDACSFYDPIV
jgi:hypothetical protein